MRRREGTRPGTRAERVTERPSTDDAPESPDATKNLLQLAIDELGGERRAGQENMATVVADAFVDGSAALIQAGTGTGKSLGYLVPAVARAVREDARIVISTATIALQRQVFQSDLPLVADALSEELGGRPRVALLKGRNNYLCRHKLAGGYPEPADELSLGEVAGPSSALGREVARLNEWAKDTGTGDRDDLVPGVTGRAWSHVSVSARECLGQKCPLVTECFSELAREEARAANVVVTNHAMLAINATSHDVLGPHDALVVDEAHELTARITQAATAELTVARVDAAARATRRCGISTEGLDDASRALDRAFDRLEVGRLRGGLPEDLALPIAAVRDSTREAITAVKDKAEEAGAAAQLAGAALSEVFAMCDTVLADEGGQVIWLAPPDGEFDATIPSRLLAAPLNVAALVGENLVGDHAAVFTSATLALGGSFASMSSALGLEDPVTLDAGSPFDYAKQGILYVAAHLERPGMGGISDEALDELEALISAAGGRTLGLFSSHRAAQAATEAIRERLDVPVFNQLDDQVSTLVSQFREDPRACLFGSKTLWQGLDIQGETCQLVVIDRIPFPRRDDPITQARSEALARSGGNGFMGVSAAHAALLLAQGAGRLIRSAEDRGVVAVLDSRLASARYASFLTRSMPQMWPTTDRESAFRALRNLDGSQTK